jgi:tetratricopeptide (TPR) repeat protein
MTGEERWQAVQALFDAARVLPRQQRAALLDACADAQLRAEVDGLLSAHERMQEGAGSRFLKELDPVAAAGLLGENVADSGRDDQLGPTIGRYHLKRRIGSGGMGVVYHARDPRLDRAVALKLLPRHLSTDAAARRRFEEEARAASSLDHPNIVTVYEIGDAPDGRLFIAMAYCEGRTLHDEMKAGALSVASVLMLARQIADGLAAAHRRGIVHRDIKPRNIIVTSEGIAKIVDFGIAKVAGSALTQTALTPGTVAYMSPEQTYGGVVDTRADVWALGAVLYEMLTGRRPFRADNDQALIYAIRHDAVVPVAELRPDAPPGLCAIVEQCLSKPAADRPDDAQALLVALDGESPDLVAGADASVDRTVREPARRRAAASGAERGSRRALPHPFGRVMVGAGIAVVVGVAAVSLRATMQPRLTPNRVAIATFDNRTGMAQLDEIARMAGDWVMQGVYETGLIEVIELDVLAGDAPGSTPHQLAREAGARLLLAGAVYFESDTARLHARLIDVADGRVVESVNPINASAAAPLAGVHQLRERIQSALTVRLDTQFTHLQAVDRPPRLEAYREYLAGRDAHAARDLPRALVHFRAAAELDSTFILPHVIGALVMNMMGNAPGADAAIRRLERDRDHLDAFSRAHVDWLRGRLSGDRSASYTAMREAARFAPGSTLVNYQLADEAVRLGRPREALELLYSFAPERGELRGWIGYWQVLVAALHLQGNHRRELKEAQRARALYTEDPRAMFLELQALAALGRTAAMEPLFSDVLSRAYSAEPNPGAIMLNTALTLRAHAAGGKRQHAVADELLGRAVAWYEGRPEAQRSVRQRYELALAFAESGRHADARRLLEQLAAATPVDRIAPSPFSPRAAPHYPDEIAYHGLNGVLSARAGDAAATETALSRLMDIPAPYTHGRPEYWRAAIVAAQGQPAAAIELLRDAFADGLAYSVSLHHAPELEPLRGQRAFEWLMRPRQ